MELFRLAWRNVFRNKRRTVLNTIALTVGIAYLIFGLGWIGGYDKYVYKSLINFETGDIQVLNKNYLKQQRRLPLDLNVNNPQKIAAALRRLAGIKAVTSRVNFSLTLSTATVSLPLLGRAIDPVHEPQVTTIKENIKQGRFFNQEQGILLGKNLAEKLHISPGDTVNIGAEDSYNVRNFLRVKVLGLFAFGYAAMDDNIVFLDLKTADQLLDLGGGVTKLVMRLDQGYSLGQMVHRVQALLNKTAGEPLYKAYPWMRFAQTTVSAVNADKNTFYIMLGIILFLVVLGVLNSLSMAVQERTAEIGTLRAMGLRRNKLLLLFINESICLALLSFGFALIISLPVAAYLQFVGIDFSQYLPKNLPIPFGKRFYADYHIYQFIESALIGLGAAVVGGILPARRAAKLIISKAAGSSHI